MESENSHLEESTMDTESEEQGSLNSKGSMLATFQTMVQQQAEILSALKGKAISHSDSKSNTADSASKRKTADSADETNADSASNETTDSVSEPGTSGECAPINYALESSDTEESENETDGEDLLAKMELMYSDSDGTGEKVNEKLAKNVNLSFRKFLSTTNQKTVKEKYKIPSNCENVKVPKVNFEIWEEARHFIKTKDLSLVKAQTLMSKAAVPIIEIVNEGLKEKGSQEEKSKTRITKASDALIMLASAFTELNQIRKDNFKRGLPAQYRNRLCNTGNEPSKDWLFGDELPKKIKEINDTRSMSSKLSRKPEMSSYRHQPYKADYRRNKIAGYGKSKPFLGKSRPHPRVKEGRT